MITHRPLLSFLTVIIAFVSVSAVTATAQNPDAVIRFVVHPADAPLPALKYQLLPPLIDRRPGNAAVWYGKVTAEQNAFFSNREILELIGDGSTMPLEEVRANKRLQEITTGNSAFEYLRHAARAEHVDWQLPIRDHPYYSILLSDVQQTRIFARLLAVRARRQIAEGDFEGAIRTFQSGYALARHVAEGPTLINGLVAFAESNTMSHQLRDFIQQPCAPNLYWALTSLPDPLIDPRPGVEAELAALELMFPVMQDPTHAEYGEQYWKEQLEEVWKTVGNYAELPSDNPAALLAITMRGYPIAKRGLIESGWAAEKVETLPVAQVVLAYSMMQYERRRDEQMKWLFVPLPATGSPESEAERSADENARDPEILPLARAFLPASGAIRYSAANAQREIAILRLVEAIRMYGARNDGRLPTSLAAITNVPIPNDPVNGKPFKYRLEQQIAVIEGAPSLPRGKPPLRIEVQFATPPSSEK